MRKMSKFLFLSQLIGNTPMAVIDYRYKGRIRTIYAKLEQYNFTGSIKDRMALNILRKAYRRKQIKAGDVIIEATSGNAGIALAGIGTALGHKVLIYMPDWLSPERVSLIKSFGAQVRLVSREAGGFQTCINNALSDARNGGVFLSRQFENEDNVEAHFLSTGPEIFVQMQSLGIIPDAFVAGVGTGGTVMGCGKFLRHVYPKITIHPLEPSNSPTLSTGYKVGKHRLQGISDEFIPEIVKLPELDSIVNVDDGDSIIIAQELSRKLGLSVGLSSGANFLGAVKLQNEIGDKSAVVTVFADCNKKYFSTDYLNQEPVKPGFLSTNIELLSFSVVPRTQIYADENVR